MSEPEHDHVVVKEPLRGYRLNGRVARASHVFVGQYDENASTPDQPAASAAAAEDPSDLIGADEAGATDEDPADS